ncbi:MAG: 16S rRNA (guanine(527)-N(7))-methyltransferase RsmG [Nitrospirae bacterium]|nr:16S rRNA (guanine(527)-N(7))-methyltransferase RsmG [Nitrospirota bacterium]
MAAKIKVKKNPRIKKTRAVKKKIKGSSARDLLLRGVEELNLHIFPNQIDQFLLYLEELKKWNKKINLTSIKEDKEIVVKHFLDSLSFLKGFSVIEGIRIIDVGTGAGFPGIPLKIYSPKIDITLIESSQKKCIFLHQICRLLELKDVRIVNDRLEEAKKSPDYIKRFNIFLSRAVGDIGEIIKHGEPLVADRGLMIFSKGKTVGGMRAGKVIKGMRLLQIIPFTLPLSDYERNLLLFQKI